MRVLNVVLDTNVLVAGLRSTKGASYRILSLVDSHAFQVNVSVPLVLEYEDVLLRPSTGIPIGAENVEAVLDHFCAVALHHDIFYLWRPVLRDPKDDMVLELAVKSGSRVIVTFNKRDFAGCERFGVEAVSPAEFLELIEGKP